jgi:uncharacterized protein (DUF4415 family)
MLKNFAKEHAAEIAASVEAEIAAVLEEVMQRVEAERLAEVRRTKALAFRIPTAEEDEAITTAALADPDSKPFTDAEWAKVKVKRRPGRPAQEVTKVATSIRLDAQVVNAFKATGDGWQTRINEVLLQYASEHEMLDA